MVSIIPGWIILFNIFRCDFDIIKQPLRLYMKILLSVETGAAFVGILSLIILINKIIFKIITYSENNKTDWGKNFAALLCICITNVSTSYVGYMVLYDWGQIKLVTVEDKYINGVIIITSFIAGWVIHITMTYISFRMCFTKQNREVIDKKIYKLVFNVKNENNMAQVTGEYISKNTKSDITDNEEILNKEDKITESSELV